MSWPLAPSPHNPRRVTELTPPQDQVPAPQPFWPYLTWLPTLLCTLVPTKYTSWNKSMRLFLCKSFSF